MWGGTCDLKKFILDYKTEVERFKAPGLFEPVIILLDNDSGLSDIFDVVRQLTRRNPKKTDRFIPVFGNLYLVLTPLTGNNPDSVIEDAFDAQTRGTILGGKTFNPASNADSARHYGKQIFSEYIRENAPKINFADFDEILERFDQVVDYHARARVVV